MTNRPDSTVYGGTGFWQRMESLRLAVASIVGCHIQCSFFFKKNGYVRAISKQIGAVTPDRGSVSDRSIDVHQHGAIYLGICAD